MNHQTHFKMAKVLTFTDFVWKHFIEFRHLDSAIDMDRYFWNANIHYPSQCIEIGSYRLIFVRCLSSISDEYPLPTLFSSLVSPLWYCRNQCLMVRWKRDDLPSIYIGSFRRILIEIELMKIGKIICSYFMFKMRCM